MKPRSFWMLVGSLWLALVVLLTWRTQFRQSEHIVSHTEVSETEGGGEEEPYYRRFFMRHIDPATEDTFYFVCFKTPEGDTLPDVVPVAHPNGDTLYFRYYLNNNGDTVLLDHEVEDDRGANDTDLWQNPADTLSEHSEEDSAFQAESDALIREIAGFLQQVESEQQQLLKAEMDSLTNPQTE